MKKHGSNLIAQVTSAVATLALLSGVMIDKVLFHLPGKDSGLYHERVAAALDLIPYHVGPWMGRDLDDPPAAVALLKPNLIRARAFTNINTGHEITFLLVQCRDARDLIGHYPPVCYRNAGYRALATARRDWQVGDLTVHGTRYDFEATRLGEQTLIGVDNFMVLPEGTTCPDMDGLHAAASDPGKKFFGTAQVQLVSDGQMSEAERDEMVATFVAANRAIIDRIRGGLTL